MKKLFCLLLCILLLTTAGCAEEEVFIDEDVEQIATETTQAAETAYFGDAIALMMKTFDNSFTQEDLYNMYPSRAGTGSRRTKVKLLRMCLTLFLSV